MSYTDILGQLLQQGLGGPTASRMQAGANAAKGSGLDGLFGQLLGAGGQGGGLDLAALAKAFLTQPQAGGMTGGQLGGIGAALGALLGGGSGAAKGAVGGGALAMLGTLAVKALQDYAASQGRAAPAVGPAQMQAMASEDTAQLALRAMIAAAKADGQIDGQEMARIMGEAGKDGTDDSEREFLLREMAAPLDIDAVVAGVGSPLVAAQVYAASLLAISVDTERERAYLASLASALGLDAPAVQRLHAAVGAPMP